MQQSNNENQNSILKGYNMLLYFTGSQIMYEPVEECVDDFWSKGILKNLPVSSSNPRFMIAASQLRESCSDTTICRILLQKDFRKLFSGQEVPLAPPFKSSYDHTSLLGNTQKENVSDFYNSYGWKKRTKYNIPDDNLGIELLFVTILIDRYISLDDEPCRSEMRNEIRRFIRIHILSWLPEWNEKIQEYAGTICYKGIANLIYASCEDIYDLLDASKSSPLSTAGFKN